MRARLGRTDQEPLHFRHLKHEQRLPYVDRISKANLRTVSVLVHKSSIQEPEKFQGRYRLYFYTVRYLLERVSWYCRDHRTSRDQGDGSAAIAFSNRSGMSYKKLREYLDLLKERTGFFDVRIDWNVIRTEQIEAHPAKKLMGLQIADAVASSFYFATQQRYGFVEDRYARMLKPVVYHHEGRYQGYGLKFWPRDVDEILKAEERFAWVRNAYGDE